MAAASSQSIAQLAEDEDDPIARRVYAQTWDPNLSMDTLGSVVAEITQRSSTLSPSEFAAKIDDMLHRLGRIDVSAQAAALEAEAAMADRDELCKMADDYLQQAVQARDDITELRQVLAEEQLAKERRVQYNALAKVILREQSREVSNQIIAEELSGIQALVSQSREIEKKKAAARMEFQLLLQCVADLEVYASTDPIAQPVSGNNLVLAPNSASDAARETVTAQEPKDVRMSDD